MNEPTKHVATKDRILDAAERLFIEKGFSETSLRDITAEAGVNLAAVNYHFQSKDALIMAVAARIITPINAQRLATLDRLEREAAGGPIPIELVLRAAVEPIFRILNTPEGAHAATLIGRVHSEPGDLHERIFKDQLAPVVARFIAVIGRSLPELPERDLRWRIQFAVAAMTHIVPGKRHFKFPDSEPTDIDAMLDSLIAFVAAGFKAPVNDKSKGEPGCNGSH